LASLLYDYTLISFQRIVHLKAILQTSNLICEFLAYLSQFWNIQVDIEHFKELWGTLKYGILSNSKTSFEVKDLKAALSPYLVLRSSIRIGTPCHYFL